MNDQYEFSSRYVGHEVHVSVQCSPQFKRLNLNLRAFGKKFVDFFEA